MFEDFGSLIREQRIKREGTIYELGEVAEVSNTYISQIENGKKLPSKKVFFLLTHFLSIHSDNGEEFKNEVFKLYSSYKDIDTDDLKDEFKIFIDDYFEVKFKGIRKLTDDITNNKIAVKKGTTDVERIEKPYFDLNWLLNQDEFEVLYHRDYDIQKTMGNNSPNFIDKMLYNRLTKEDIKTINDLINAYISNKYKKFPKNNRTDVNG